MQPWPADTECPYEFWPEFKSLLDQARYHFADDTGNEWQKGVIYIEDAANMAADLEMPFWVITRLVREAKSLVTLDTFMSKMLNYLYRQKGI